MPSIDPPTWRGVSTNRRQSTIHYLAQELQRFEQSITTMRENLDNRNRNLPSLDTSNDNNMGNNRDNLANALQDLDASSAEQKRRIEIVLQSNAVFKSEMEMYLRESETWNLALVEESKKIEIELHQSDMKAVPFPRNMSENRLVTVANKTKYWCNILGTAGRNCITNLKRKWDAADFSNLRPGFIMPDAAVYYF